MTTHIPPGDAGNHTYEVHEHNGWAALYVDGKLDTGPGDSYYVDERLAEILGAKVVRDNAFMRGGGLGDHAETLDEVHAYEVERQDRLDEAAAKRAEAARLLDEANGLDPTGGRS